MTRMSAFEAYENKHAGKPVFESIPAPGIKRIYGLDGELGCEVAYRENDLFSERELEETLLDQFPEFLSNGGKLSLDMSHPEISTPETSNPLEAIVYDEALGIFCLNFMQRIFNGKKVSLFKDNADYGIIEKEGRISPANSYGAHESYSISGMKPWHLEPILPFLVTRQITCGSGYLTPEGNYCISQRAGFMRRALGKGTTVSEERPILEYRDEPHANIPGLCRLHLILGDANMCQYSAFLKLVSTGLVLKLAEEKEIPQITEIDKYNAVSEIKKISQLGNEWINEKFVIPKRAIDIQRQYLERAKKYLDISIQEKYGLSIWEETLNLLEEDPFSLFGKVDYITKMALIIMQAKEESLRADDPFLRSIALDYHSLNRKKGLFYYLKSNGKIDALVPDELIYKAIENPPNDTRAFLRGNIVKKLLESSYRGYGNSTVLTGTNWDKMELSFISQKIPKWWEIIALRIFGDPFDNYRNVVEHINEYDKSEVSSKFLA